MKVCHLVFPALALSQSDDTPTLLSMKMKVHSTLATGVDHLLDVVGSRNVTEMSALIQNLVEDTISQGEGSEGYALDGEVQAALQMIKDALLGDIRGALKDAHCQDQKELHETILCYEKCEVTRTEGASSCGSSCDGTEHKECRDRLFVQYNEHITKCRALDDFVWDFSKNNCPTMPKKCCLLSHTTWNCGGLCETQIAHMDVDASLGTWIQKQINSFTRGFTEWDKLHKECTKAYHTYIELDAQCDCSQAKCETQNCEYESCHYLNCEDNYNTCWGRCEGQYTRTNEAKECLEKDRKIDWSATEKIECFVNVLLEKPDNQTLLDTCGTDDCFNKYRELMYHKCNDICVEVDFEGEWGHHGRRVHEEGDYSGRLTDVKDQSTHKWADIDVTDEGETSVYTKHRGDGEDRCTSHLDLDYQLPPCCHPCEERPPAPCEGRGDISDDSSYMWLHYGQFGHLSTQAIPSMSQQICHSGEHTKSYAYNLCDCIACSAPQPVQPPTCTAAKKCEAAYDYRQHDIKNDCGVPPAPPPPMPLPESNCPTPKDSKACHFWGDPHFTHLFNSEIKLDANRKGGRHHGTNQDFRPLGVFNLASNADESFEAQAFFCPWGRGGRAPGVGNGVAMRFGADTIQMMRGDDNTRSANFTKFYLNGKHVPWEDLGKGTAAQIRGRNVPGQGGISTNFMYMQQQATNNQNPYLPVCAGNGQDSLVEVGAMGKYYQAVTIRSNQPGAKGICSVPHGKISSDAATQEEYRVPQKNILFSSRQMKHFCQKCGLDMRSGACGAPGHDVLPEDVCKTSGVEFEEAKAGCAKVFQSSGAEENWFWTCVMESCASGEEQEAVSISKIEEHVQAMMIEEE